MIEEQPPPILYKYISWDNEYHKKILTENKIFFSSACNFNDPFDSYIFIQKEKIENLDYDKALEFVKKSIKIDNPGLNDVEIESIAKKQYDKDLFKDSENIIFSHKYVRDSAYENFGILSLSEIRHNILMWSHYAHSHQGICIGFDTSILKACFYETFKKYRIAIMPFKVIYQIDYPIIDPNNPAPDNFKMQFTIKSLDWCYEKEWRYILFDRTNFEIEIPQNAISVVILGSRIPRDHRMEIIELLRNKNMDISLMQNWVSLKKFKLEYYPVKYYIRHN
jgi:hypothetical protein